MSCLLVVSTCPRPAGAVYLGATLRGLDAAGATELERVIVSNGPPVDHADAWAPGWPAPHETHHGGPLSSRTNLWAAIRLARARGRDLLYFEDDLACCHNAVRRMAATPCPDGCAFVSFFDGKRRRTYAGPLTTAPLPWDSDRQGFWGTLAMRLPLRTLAYLAPLDPFADPFADLPELCGADVALARSCAHSPWPRVAYHVPSLVRHVGVSSAARPGVTSPAPPIPHSYLGDNFDALGLAPFGGGLA